MNSLGETSMWQPHVCQCCLRQGCYKELSSEYFFMGVKEIYEEMLFTVFNITMSSKPRDGRICEECIQKLRDGDGFKRQVLRSQLALQCATSDTGKAEIELQNPEVKLEQDFPEDDISIHDDGLYMAGSPNSGLKMEVSVLPEVKAPKKPRASNDQQEKPKGVIYLAFGNKLKMTLLKLSHTVYRHSASKRKHKVHQRPKGSEKIASTESDTKKKEVHMKTTTLDLVLNSNLTLFDWCKNKYRCFFCKEMFLDTALLKEHSQTHGEEEMQLKIFKYNVKYYYRAEISDLQCNHCLKGAENLSELTQHLSTIHNINFKTQDSLLMPYKLTNLTCQLCKQEFQSFVVLDHHMTSHYSKYVCDTCGKGFRQKYCLRSHLVTHVKKLFTCKPCDLTFDNYYRKRKHDVTQHDVSDKFNSCPHCPEKFIHYAGRLKHLIKAHGYKKPEFKCTSCEKVYMNNALLRSHVRNVHLQERNFECNMCQNKYLWKCELTDHMKSHIQARDFVCTYCGKGFYRRRNLNEHLAIHVEEFRHACAVCGKSFAQKYNMKMHMRRCQDSKRK